MTDHEHRVDERGRDAEDERVDRDPAAVTRQLVGAIVVAVVLRASAAAGLSAPPRGEVVAPPAAAAAPRRRRRRELGLDEVEGAHMTVTS